MESYVSPAMVKISGGADNSADLGAAAVVVVVIALAAVFY